MRGQHTGTESAPGGTASEGAPKVSQTDHLGYAHLLGQVDLFLGLERVTLAKLAAHLEPLFYPSGSIIFRQAEPGDAFYLVATGSVGVYSTGRTSAAETRVKVLHAGEPFGEMALLTNSPRTATIKAEADCEVLRLDRSSFLDLVREQPSVALSIAATLSRRLAAMLDQPEAVDATAAPAEAHADVETVGAGAQLRWRPGRGGLALMAALGILGLGWALPPPAGLSAPAWHALVVLLAALPALMLDALMEGVLALLIAGGWVVFGVTSPTVALTGFASTNWVLVVAVLIIGAAITSTGVLYRLALESIARMRGGFPGEVTALSLAGLLIGPAVPNGTSRVIMIAPMLKELVEALGYRPQSKAAAGLAMAVLIGFGQMAAVFLTSSNTAVLVLAVLPAGARGDVNWITWCLNGARGEARAGRGLGDARGLCNRAPTRRGSILDCRSGSRRASGNARRECKHLTCCQLELCAAVRGPHQPCCRVRTYRPRSLDGGFDHRQCWRLAGDARLVRRRVGPALLCDQLRCALAGSSAADHHRARAGRRRVRHASLHRRPGCRYCV